MDSDSTLSQLPTNQYLLAQLEELKIKYAVMVEANGVLSNQNRELESLSEQFQLKYQEAETRCKTQAIARKTKDYQFCKAIVKLEQLENINAATTSEVQASVLIAWVVNLFNIRSQD